MKQNNKNKYLLQKYNTVYIINNKGHPYTVACYTSKKKIITVNKVTFKIQFTAFDSNKRH